MNRYYVHYEVTAVAGPGVAGYPGRIAWMIMPVDAESEAEAIKICKAERPGSYAHRIVTPDKKAAV